MAFLPLGKMGRNMNIRSNYGNANEFKTISFFPDSIIMKTDFCPYLTLFVTIKSGEESAP